MGFLGGLLSGAVSLGKAALGGIKSIISSGVIGELVGKGISWVKNNIFNLEETPSYNPREATVDETRKINELIERCIESYGPESKKYDQLAQETIEEQFNLIISSLRDINTISNEIIVDEYIFNNFNFNLSMIKEQLGNIYSKNISNVFSLNNQDLLDILELEKGDVKKRKLRRLAMETLEKSSIDLRTKLTKFTQEQQKFINDKLNDCMNQRKNEIEISKKETEKIIFDREKNKDENENKKNKYTEIIEHLENLKKILGRK